MNDEKVLTPMKRYNNAFKKMRNLLSFDFGVVELTKRKKRYPDSWNSFHGKKEIKDDYILFFKYHSTDRTLGFIINYEKEPIQIIATLKKAEVYESRPMDMETFRLKINAFNKELENKKTKKDDRFSRDDYFKIFENNFEIKIIDYNLKQKEAEEKIKDFLIKKSKTLDNQNKEIEKLEKKLINAHEKFKKEYRELPEHKELQEILKQERKIREKLRDKKEILMVKNKISEKEKAVENAKIEFEQKEKNFNKEKENKLSGYPRKIINKIN